MNQVLSRKVFSFIMEFIHKNGYKDLDDYASNLARNYCRLLLKAPNGFSEEDFLRSTNNIKTIFFRINRIKKRDFVYAIHSSLGKINIKCYIEVYGFDVAKNFISKYLEVGYDKSKFTNERDNNLIKFKNIRNPHDKLNKSFEVLLYKISKTYQVTLHGTKEYSGIDLLKKMDGATIGFQLKSVNDNISEDKIRAQTSKALEYKLDGFVLMYGRPPTKKVESSIQAAYHHFNKINETRKTYCTLIPPELLADLYRRYKIDL